MTFQFTRIGPTEQLGVCPHCAARHTVLHPFTATSEQIFEAKKAASESHAFDCPNLSSADWVPPQKKAYTPPTITSKPYVHDS